MKRTLSILLSVLMLLSAVLPCLPAFAQDGDTNVALGKPVTATATANGHISSYITDGDIGTYWDGDHYPSSATIDLGGWYKISEINVVTYYGNRYYHFDVAVSSNGTDFTVIGQKNDDSYATADGTTFSSLDVTARYVRVNMTFNSANTAVHIREVTVMGHRDPAFEIPDYTMELDYTYSNTLRGSAAGTVTLTAIGEFAIGTFGIYWLDENEKPLTATVGDKVLPYSSLTDFVVTGGTEAQEYSYTILPFTAIPHGAAYLGVCDNKGKVVDKVEIPAEKRLAEASTNFSFGIVSDIHFNTWGLTGTAGGEQTEYKDQAEYNLRKAMQFYKDANVDLVTTTGDYSTYGEESAYTKFVAATSVFDRPILSCSGNHDTRADLSGFFRSNMNKGVYDGTLPGVLNVAENGLDFVYQIPGQENSVFIFFNQMYWDNRLESQNLVEMPQIEWLAEQLETYSDKTVFFFFHTYFYDDDYETADGEGDITGPAGATYGYGCTHTEDVIALTELLAKYRNVTFYNGHSHFVYAMQKYNANLNIFNNEGTTATMVHVPSVTGPRIITDTLGPGDAGSYITLNGQTSQGALVTVYNGYNLMNGVDFWNEQILSYACYITYDDKDTVITENTVSDGKVTWTYDEQTQSLRFTGEGAIPDYENADAAPWAAYKDTVKTVYVSSGITSVGANAFAGFASVTDAQVKGGSSIGESAFALCTALKNVTLPETLKTVGENAFAGDAAITALTFDGTAEKYGQIQFAAGNETLTGATKSYHKFSVTWVVEDTVKVDDVQKYKYPAYDGSTGRLSGDGTKLYPFLGWRKDDSSSIIDAGKTIPRATATVTYTAVYGEAEDRYVEETIAGTDITWTLDRYTGVLAFEGTDNIPGYSWGSNRAPWVQYAAEICVLEIAGSIENVGKETFCHLPSLHTVKLGEGVKSLGSDALSYNGNLKTLYLPASLQSLGQGVFYSSDNVSVIYYSGTSSQWKLFTQGITAPSNGAVKDFKGELHCTGDLPENVDVNGDGELSILDVTLLLLHMSDRSTPIFGTGDITKDGTVSIKDVTKLLILLG